MKALRGVRIGLRFVSPGGTFAVSGEAAREMLRAGTATLLYPARDLARLGHTAVDFVALGDDSPTTRLMLR